MPISDSVIYQLKVVLQGISPMIWRRLLIRDDTTIVDLHYILQIAMGWSDDHLHQFRIHGKRYGIARMGGILFSDDPDAFRLKDLGLRINERFVYEYDFTDNWQHLIHLEAILAPEPHRRYPVCIDGRRACPPEDCGGPWAFMELRQNYSFFHIMDILQEVLPIGNSINAATVRNNVHVVRHRIDKELGKERMGFIDGCEFDREQLPRPDLPLTVGIDGGYVHSNSQCSRKEGWFEVIAGKSVTAEGASKRFAFVNNYDNQSKRRLFEVLKSQGRQANQQVTFLSDGADTVRQLQLYMNPNAEHLLDWFHITMRLTVMRRMAKGHRGRVLIY